MKSSLIQFFSLMLLSQAIPLQKIGFDQNISANFADQNAGQIHKSHLFTENTPTGNVLDLELGIQTGHNGNIFHNLDQRATTSLDEDTTTGNLFQSESSSANHLTGDSLTNFNIDSDLIFAAKIDQNISSTFHNVTSTQTLTADSGEFRNSVTDDNEFTTALNDQAGGQDIIEASLRKNQVGRVSGNDSSMVIKNRQEGGADGLGPYYSQVDSTVQQVDDGSTSLYLNQSVDQVRKNVDASGNETPQFTYENNSNLNASVENKQGTSEIEYDGQRADLGQGISNKIQIYFDGTKTDVTANTKGKITVH